MNNTVGEKVFHGAVIIVLVGVLAKFAAFISSAVLASYLGTSYQSDAYYMVVSIKDVFYPMMSVGIWKVFFPLYKEKITQDHLIDANALANKAVSFFTLISIVFVIFIVIYSELIVSVIAPGFQGETKTLCIKLVRISAPMNIVIIASAVYASMLQCHNKFFGSEIRDAATHIPTILAALLFYNYFGIEVLAIALVIGGLIRLLIEIPFVDWGYRYKPDFNFTTKDFLLMLKRLPSALVSAGVNQFNTLVDKIMASMLPVGAISGLNYGQKLTNVFSGLLSSAIATALYPQMIELIALKKLDELSKLIVRIINVFCILMIPIIFSAILFRTELVSAVFQRGLFDENSVALTSGTFALYCLGILFISCNTIITNLFYGIGNTRIPMTISLLNLGVNVALNFLFVRFWGVNGIALATSVSAFITFFIQVKAASQYIQFEYKNMLTVAFKVLICSAFASLIPRFIFNIYPINKYLILTFSAAMGMFIYFVSIRLLQVEEWNYVLELLLQKVKKRNKK